MPDVRWVRQEHTHGCGVAVLAMLTGRTYAEAGALFERDFGRDGLSIMCIDAALADLGYATRRIFEVAGYRRAVPPPLPPRQPWPPAPFADVHHASVVAGGCSHAVVLLRDGTVLDPATPGPKRLADYSRVLSVAGVYEVGR